MAEAGDFLEPSATRSGDARAAALRRLVGRFYEDLANRLLQGADEGFELAGVSVPNVHPRLGARRLRAADGGEDADRRGEFAGIACLGVVIRGETDHYDFVCAEAARGIQDVQLETGVPCAFGVITCDTMEQALARAGGDKRDQGRNAALTVARMALLRRQVAGRPPGGGPAIIYHPRSRWPRFVTAAERDRRSASPEATRWSPPSGASTRTCRRSGSRRTAASCGLMSAPAA